MNLILPYSIALNLLENTGLSAETFDVDENKYVKLHINFSNNTCVITKTDLSPTKEDLTFASMLLNEE